MVDLYRSAVRPIMVLWVIALAASDCRAEEVPVPSEAIPSIRPLLDSVGPGNTMVHEKPAAMLGWATDSSELLRGL
jgi:hypothetical protein